MVGRNTTGIYDIGLQFIRPENTLFVKEIKMDKQKGRTGAFGHLDKQILNPSDERRTASDESVKGVIDKQGDRPRWRWGHYSFR
jgi:hypothetical protein